MTKVYLFRITDGTPALGAERPFVVAFKAKDLQSALNKVQTWHPAPHYAFELIPENDKIDRLQNYAL